MRTTRTKTDSPFRAASSVIRAEKISISAYGSTEVTPAPTNPAVGFVQVPGATGSTTTPGTQSVANQRCKPEFPKTDAFVADHISMLQQKLNNISKT